MSWTDRAAQKVFSRLQKEFNIQTAIETGTYKGMGVENLCQFFPFVSSVENNKDYLELAIKRLQMSGIVERTGSRWDLFLDDSSHFLRRFKKERKGKELIFFYLDAHFYDPTRKQKWVLVDELKALEGFGECIICTHDFDNGELGHLRYEGEDLNWDIIKDYIRKVYPNFYYYTNTKEGCDIYDEETIYQSGLMVDEYVLDNVRFANTSDEKRYRGILYCVPKKLDLTKYRLREFKEAYA